MVEFIADILLIAGAFAAAFYCIVLSRRLKRFNDLEKGVGGAIAVLSTQVDDMTKTLTLAQQTATGSNDSLETLTSRAEDVAKRLEILVATMHDIPPVGDAMPPEPSGATGARNGTESGVHAKLDPETSAGFRSARIDRARSVA